jgi:Na+-transporting NADH:ubiquinone oxidoreductase subunit NqrC
MSVLKSKEHMFNGTVTAKLVDLRAGEFDTKDYQTFDPLKAAKIKSCPAC